VTDPVLAPVLIVSGTGAGLGPEFGGRFRGIG
jgi:hypothetical protein